MTTAEDALMQSLRNAHAVGDHETKRVCDEIAREEEALAERLKPILPAVMTECLRWEQSGEAAKR